MPSITEIVNGVVYLLTSPSRKQYVGQTWDYETRMCAYKNKQARGQAALHAAIRKYGWENFTSVIIAQGIQTQSALDATEKAFIRLLNTIAPNGYNLMSGGGGGKHHAETRAKLSAAQRGEKNHNFGKSPSAETRAKLSASKRGEKHPNFGKKHTAATRAKMSAANRGKSKSPEHRAKMSAAQRGEKNHNFGKSPSAESRAKMSASAKARWARERAASESTASLF